MRLLSAQFLSKGLSPRHPSHKWATAERGRRSMKEMLRSKVFPIVEPYVDGDGKIQPGRTREVMSDIHTDVVKDIGEVGPK